MHVWQRPQKDSAARFQQFIADEMESLLKTLSYYVVQAGLANREAARQEAIELLNEVVVEALEHPDRFVQSDQPKAWVLGVAAKLIKRKQVRAAKLHQREPLVRDLYENTQARLNDEELFEQLAECVTGNTSTEAIEMNESVAALLSGLSADDQRVLRLAIVADLDGASLARELGISPVAARVRLHRALSRLRETQLKLKERDNGN